MEARRTLRMAREGKITLTPEGLLDALLAETGDEELAQAAATKYARDMLREARATQ